MNNTTATEFALYDPFSHADENWRAFVVNSVNDKMRLFVMNFKSSQTLSPDHPEVYKLFSPNPSYTINTSVPLICGPTLGNYDTQGCVGMCFSFAENGTIYVGLKMFVSVPPNQELRAVLPMIHN